MSAAAVPEDAFDRAGQRLAERLNPIIVKEVRQGLRTRVFWVFFSLMLFACLVISLVAAAVADGVGSDGKAFFFAYFLCLGVVQFFVIPYSAYRSMAREREEETWVLLTLTGLGPKRILRGKMGSHMLQGVLYASACMPFLLFSYFLNGIDLPTIFSTMLLATAYQLFLTAVAVSTATLAESRLVRGLLHFLLLGFLLWGLITGLTSSFGLMEAGRTLFSSGPAWLGLGGGWWAIATWGVLLYEAAAARLSLPTESYAIGYRLTFVVQVLGALGLAVLGAVSASEAGVLFVAAMVLLGHCLVVGLFIASDRDGMAKALRARKMPWLLKPGGLRGYVLVLLTVLLLSALALFGFDALGGKEEHLDEVLFTAPAFVVIYLSLPVLATRLVRHPGFMTAGLTRVFFFIILIFACGGPPLFSALLLDKGDAVLPNLLNPIVGLINLGDGKGGQVGIAVPWLMALLLAAGTVNALWRNDTAAADAREPGRA